MRIVTASQMKDLDNRTINEIGIPGSVLMENAGKGTFLNIAERFQDVGSRRVVVMCGRGNNGGDGFVIARYLLNTGCSLTTAVLSRVDTISGDAGIHCRAFQKTGGNIHEIAGEGQWQRFADRLRNADIIIDALLGTGLSKEVTGLFRRAIDEINTSNAYGVVSVDVPSGIDATTGKCLGAAVQADMTCTFGLAKRGLVVYPGALFAGEVKVVDIGIPESLLAGQENPEWLLDEEDLKGVLPSREPDSHKGSYGHLCVIAGSPGKTGAAILAARAAMRTGAGLVTLAAPQALHPVFEQKVTEVMTEPLNDEGTGFVGTPSWRRTTEVLAGKTAVALGPGLGDSDDTAEYVGKLLEYSAVPLVVDADGINALARSPEMIRKASCPVVLTPHPGEMARLMQCSVKQVQDDRVNTARELACRFGVVVVLKGARTVIAGPKGCCCINPTGNPGMASGGMGDALTGMIAGLIAQGGTPFQSAQLAVFVHGRIGDTLAVAQGPLGMLASDIIERIPTALKDFFD